MHRFGFVAVVAALACLPAFGDDGDRNVSLMDAAQVHEKALQEVIKQAEPSIVWVLVSRSEAYKKIFHDEPSADNPGRLGGFDKSRAEPAAQRPRLRHRFGRDLKTPEDELDQYNLALKDAIPETYGSGVVIDGQELFILTNYHVVRDATKIYVCVPDPDGSRKASETRTGSYANIHAADPRSDLAVLRLIDKSVGPLKAIKSGDADKLQKGSFVVSLASPFAAGFREASPSASTGIVSELHQLARGSPREFDGQFWKPKPLFAVKTLIHADMRLNAGCSGGALLNLKGEMVGLTTAREFTPGSDRAGGFAVPINGTMKRIIEILRAGKEVNYGYLGVNSTKDPNGRLRISGVQPGSPAHNAGLQRDSVIVSVNGVRVYEPDDLYLTIATLLAGTTARIEIYGLSGPVEVTLAKSYTPGKIIASSKPDLVRGMRVDYTSVLDVNQPPPQFPRFPRGGGGGGGIPVGVFVCELQPGSKAAAQLRLNDIITRVGHSDVKTPEEFYRDAASIPASQPLELTLLSGDHVRID